MNVIGRWTRVRVVACGVIFGALFLALARRAYVLQIVDRDRMRTLAEEQYLREIELPPKRGRIMDRNGSPLASSAEVDSIYCNPRQLSIPEAARKLAKLLDLDRRELEKRLHQKRYFAWLKRKVTPDEVAAVKALGLPGIGFTREPRRFYPNRTLAATVMGHAGADGRGLDGVELAFDRVLRGSSSSMQGVRDALGRELLVDGLTDVTGGSGSDVVLTLDRYLTFVMEKALADAVASTHAKGIMSAMMDVRTGEVLAMASMPTYNPNDPGDAAAAGARNRVITDAYEPGSTMKTFTIAAALDAGVVRPGDPFDCMMGRMMVGKYQIHDTHPHGALTVTDVFRFSSNIGAAKIGRKLGKDKLAESFRRFGFGHPTGLGLPGERSGILRPTERWGDIGLANVSFGQGLTVTPLQVLAGVSAIAAGGVYNPPRIVARLVHEDGRQEVPATQPARRVMSETASRQMIEIMKSVTGQGGTAKAAAIDGYSVGGKTGTAQKVSGGHYDPSKWIASFVGFAPASDPRIAIIVVVDEPQGVHLGGAVAAPVFREIGEQALRYLHVQPDEKPAVAKDNGKDKGSGRKSAPADDDEAPGSDVALEDDAPLGDDDAEDQVAAEQAQQANESEKTQVPSFVGMTMAEAIHAAQKSGVELAIQGSGVAQSQRPAPGPARRGAVCRVSFSPRL